MKNMTVGSPAKHILLFALPMLIGNLFQQFYSMVDAIIVGKYIGVDELAAVGATGSLSFLILGFVNGVTLGFSVLISQKYGANDEKGVRKAYAMTIIMSVVLSVVLTVAALLLQRKLLIIMKTPDEIIDMASEYISVIFAGIVVTMFYNVFACVMRALGNSRIPLYFLIISSILNVALDLFFVIVLKLGVAGAALATVVAQLVSVILCAIVIKKKFSILKLSREDYKLSFKTMGKLLMLGLPLGFQTSITAIGVIAIQVAVNRLGTIAIASFTAASKVEQLALQPSLSFGLSLATYSAQNLGAGKFDRIRKGVKSCMAISLTVCVLLGVVLAVFGREITSLFLSGDEPPETVAQVLDYSQMYLVIASAFVWVLGLLYIYRNALQGIGNSVIPFLSGVVELIVRVAVAMTLSVSMGFFGISASSPIAWIGATIPLMISFYIVIRRREKKAVLLGLEEAEPVMLEPETVE